MKRRNFIKILIGSVIVPTSLLNTKLKLHSTPWKNYFAVHNLNQFENQKLLKQMRKAFKETRFHPPLFFNGVPLVYKNKF